MRARPAIATLALLAYLTGCASASPVAEQPTPTSTPTPTPVDPNIAACDEFADVTTKMADVLKDGESTKDDWDATIAELDSVGLSAEGDVKDRILAITNDPPSFGDVFFGKSTIVEDLKRVNRACGWG